MFKNATPYGLDLDDDVSIQKFNKRKKCQNVHAKADHEDGHKYAIVVVIVLSEHQLAFNLELDPCLILSVL